MFSPVSRAPSNVSYSSNRDVISKRPEVTAEVIEHKQASEPTISSGIARAGVIAGAVGATTGYMSFALTGGAVAAAIFAGKFGNYVIDRWQKREREEIRDATSKALELCNAGVSGFSDIYEKLTNKNIPNEEKKAWVNATNVSYKQRKENIQLILNDVKKCADSTERLYSTQIFEPLLQESYDTARQYLEKNIHKMHSSTIFDNKQCLGNSCARHNIYIMKGAKEEKDYAKNQKLIDEYVDFTCEKIIEKGISLVDEGKRCVGEPQDMLAETYYPFDAWLVNKGFSDFFYFNPELIQADINYQTKEINKTITVEAIPQFETSSLNEQKVRRKPIEKSSTSATGIPTDKPVAKKTKIDVLYNELYLQQLELLRRKDEGASNKVFNKLAQIEQDLKAGRISTKRIGDVFVYDIPSLDDHSTKGSGSSATGRGRYRLLVSQITHPTDAEKKAYQFRHICDYHKSGPPRLWGY